MQRGAEVRDRFGLLLVLLVGAFVTLGFAADSWARVLAAALQLAALVVAFLATGLRSTYRWLGLVASAGVAAILLTAMSGDVAQGVGSVASVVVLLVILIAVLDRVIRHEHVTLQTLYGAVCAYLLIGLMFGSVYAALDALAEQPLFGEPVDRSVHSYFSLTTLTTVGFGDYTAATDAARRIVVIEAVIGQVFIATTLARLVSLYRSNRSEP